MIRGLGKQRSVLVLTLGVGGKEQSIVQSMRKGKTI
jgi:hypothetical protein